MDQEKEDRPSESSKSQEDTPRKISDSTKKSHISKINDNGRSEALSTPTRGGTPSTPKTSTMLPPARPALSNKKRNSSDKGKPVALRPKTPSRTGQASAVEKIVEKINQQSPQKSNDDDVVETSVVTEASTVDAEPDLSIIEPEIIEQTSSDDLPIDAPEENDGWTPNQPIPPFEWDDLAQRHADAMQDFERREEEVMEDFRNTAQLFESWVVAGHEKDTQRSTKRLKLRFDYIQHEEAELEQRREHYIKVVRAFKDALQLLAP